MREELAVGQSLGDWFGCASRKAPKILEGPGCFSWAVRGAESLSTGIGEPIRDFGAVRGSKVGPKK